MGFDHRRTACWESWWHLGEKLRDQEHAGRTLILVLSLSARGEVGAHQVYCHRGARPPKRQNFPARLEAGLSHVLARRNLAAKGLFWKLAADVLKRVKGAGSLLQRVLWWSWKRTIVEREDVVQILHQGGLSSGRKREFQMAIYCVFLQSVLGRGWKWLY